MTPLTLAPILWILSAVMFGAWLVVSWVLTYHWRSYSKNNKTVKRAQRIYYVVSLIIFVSIGLLIFSL